MSKKSSPTRYAGRKLAQAVPSMGANLAAGGAAVWAHQPALAAAIVAAQVMIVAAQVSPQLVDSLSRLITHVTRCWIAARAQRAGGDPIALIGALTDPDNEQR